PLPPQMNSTLFLALVLALIGSAMSANVIAATCSKLKVIDGFSCETLGGLYCWEYKQMSTWNVAAGITPLLPSTLFTPRTAFQPAIAANVTAGTPAVPAVPAALATCTLTKCGNGTVDLAPYVVLCPSVINWTGAASSAGTASLGMAVAAVAAFAMLMV
ncbi:hypothetical protein TeGR_g848, partial [Tetraparma gracilis]